MREKSSPVPDGGLDRTRVQRRALPAHREEKFVR